MSQETRIGRWLRRSPALHFLVLGTALFLGEAWLGTSADVADVSRVLTLSSSRVEQLRGQWQAASGRLPDAVEEASLIRRWAEEEMLHREALALELDREDPGVCYRLALNMRFLGLAPSLADAPPAESADERDRQQRHLCARARELGLHRGDPVVRRQMAELMRLVLKNSPTLSQEEYEPISRDDLREYLERHRERFSEPARLRLSHVFLSRDRRGEALEESALRLLEEFTAEGFPEQDRRSSASLGDPFLPGPPPELSSRKDLERVFGGGFARAVMALPEARWSPPVASSYGLHLVWVHERRPPRLRRLEEVEEQSLRGVKAERAEQRLQTALDKLRTRWEVRVERRNNV